MNSLKEQITNDMKDAMRAKDTERLVTIRMLLAAIKQREIDERIELDDTATLTIVNKMIKQRRDSITQFEAADRPELAAKEAQEITVLEVYLPAQLSEDEITQAIEKAIADTGATTMKDMGKIMGILKSQLTGRADMGKVSAKIKSILAG